MLQLSQEKGQGTTKCEDLHDLLSDYVDSAISRGLGVPDVPRRERGATTLNAASSSRVRKRRMTSGRRKANRNSSGEILQLRIRPLHQQSFRR